MNPDGSGQVIEEEDHFIFFDGMDGIYYNLGMGFWWDRFVGWVGRNGT